MWVVVYLGSYTYALVAVNRFAVVMSWRFHLWVIGAIGLLRLLDYWRYSLKALRVVCAVASSDLLSQKSDLCRDAKVRSHLLSAKFAMFVR